MRHLIYSENQDNEYPVAILSSTISAKDFKAYYLDPYGIPVDPVICLESFSKPGVKKTPVAEIKAFIKEQLVTVLEDCKTKYVLCSDSEYFKALTGISSKVEANLGYVLDSVFGSFKVIYVPSVKTRFYDPAAWDTKTSKGIQAMVAYEEGTYSAPGTGILKNVSYPKTYLEIQCALADLLAKDCDLSCDIEAFSLKHYLAGIGSIAFAWDENNGIAFNVDYKPLDEKSPEGFYGKQIDNQPVKDLLRAFFKKFSRKMLYHNIAFDVTVLISDLFMEDLLDTEGLLTGMDYMLSNWECTKLISYLATNSCGGNELSLKTQSQEFAGNYAEEEIKDIRKIPLDDLLQYNLVDSCATWFAYNKNHPVMVQDEQLEIYETIFKPATLDIIQMQLTGMPLNMATVKKVKGELQKDFDSALNRIWDNKHTHELIQIRAEEWVTERNEKLVKKRVSFEDAEKLFEKERTYQTKERSVDDKKKPISIDFNPNSNPQMARLLYEQIGLPVIETTKSGAPACDGDTIKALKNHTTNESVKELLTAFEDYAAVSKILTSFIPAMESAVKGPDGWHYLFGFFNLGGTVSGRLSSSNP